MKSSAVRLIQWFGILVLGVGTVSAAAPTLRVVVDATDLPRGLLTATMTVPIVSGGVDLFYPEWIEGVHGPNNPIQNLAGLEFKDPEGGIIPWIRHPDDLFRFQAEAKELQNLDVQTTYICNSAGVTSTGIDSYGTSQLGIVCWNTCLLYPVGASIYDLTVDLTLKLPPGWSWASALEARNETNNLVTFQTVSFQQLMDSPLICGENVRIIDITPSGRPTHKLALVSESKQALRLEDGMQKKLTHLVEESCQLFGADHDYPYTFLLALSDHLPFIGLEHTRSSLNAVGENGLEDEEAALKTGQLIAHEFAHRWSGKYHRPAGMARDNYNTPKDTRLLWVYEGLDQYLGVVLAARSGLFATKKQSAFEGALKGSWMGIGPTTVRLMRQKGRRFMNLEDTAASSYVRRSAGQHWTALRRSQDYYQEGGLLWFEIDAILRAETDGRITLDTFNQKFLGPYDPEKPLIPFDESDILKILNELLPFDWKSLIDQRVRGYEKELSLTVLSRLGYRLEYSPKPTDFDKDISTTSLGMRVDDKGSIQTIIPGGIADLAQLAEGDEIVGVNNKKFSRNRLRDAIAESPVDRRIVLLLLKGDLFKTVDLPYDGGPKYIDLIRKESEPDLLKDILKPKRPEAQSNPSPIPPE